MRQWIALFEKVFVPADLEDYASAWCDGHGAAHHPDALLPASAYEWRYEPEYPLANLDGDSPVDSYREMMIGDIAAWKEDGDPHRYDDMFEREIEEPIVVVELNGKGHIVDGCHRTGASLMQDKTTIPAVVGVLRRA